VPRRTRPRQSLQTRQLNLWGFKRELRGPDTEGESFYHQYFHRGKLEELQLIQRTEIKRRSSSSKKQQSDALSLSRQCSTMTGNHDGFSIQGANPQQMGDITQGASFLTGLKGSPDNLLRANSVSGGGLPNAAYYFNMQGGPSQMSNNMIAFKTSSLPTTMQTQMMQSQMMNPHRLHPSRQEMMMQHQMMMQQPQSMMQHQIFQGYPTGGGNWNPNREMLSQMSTQELAVMAQNMNGGRSSMYNNNMNGFNMMHPSMGCNLTDGAHATPLYVSGSGLSAPNFRRISSSLSSGGLMPRLDNSGEDQTNEGDLPSQPLPRAA
jgi:hypothetical protein